MNVLEILALSIGLFVLGIIAFYVFVLMLAVLVSLVTPKRKPRSDKCG